MPCDNSRLFTYITTMQAILFVYFVFTMHVGLGFVQALPRQGLRCALIMHRLAAAC